MNRAHGNRGFSMIEVLVTILLISIGVLGLVALQGRTIAYTQDSAQRNAAAMLADDLQEMMRADLDNVITATGLPRDSSAYYKAKTADFPNPASDCTSLASATAQQKLGCWAKKVEASLPGAADLMKNEFHICPTTKSGGCGNSGDKYAIEIQLAWTVKGGECLTKESETNEYCTYAVRAEF